MHFEIRPSGPAWGWVLLSASGEQVAESHQTYPSQSQASAAALAWSQLVHRAGRSMPRS